MDKCTKGKAGENMEGGGDAEGGMKAWAQYCVFTSTYGHIRSSTLFPLKAALLYSTSANATTIHNILSTSGPSPAAPFNCLY